MKESCLINLRRELIGQLLLERIDRRRRRVGAFCFINGTDLLVRVQHRRVISIAKRIADLHEAGA